MFPFLYGIDQIVNFFERYSGYNKRLISFSSLELSSYSFRACNYARVAMDTSLSICFQFDIKIPRRKFVNISSIMKSESTLKGWHRFDVDNSTSIRLSKSMKYRWVLCVFFLFWTPCLILYCFCSELLAWHYTNFCFYFALL